ncbi:hypothetical protein E3J62_09390 [candidate division TA06 bacterium]|uniref:Uncharacterized protein n=1 Tax=candidate division TA06 bacterium TaxID=2250710 RepID=A0A523UQP3_UNCT6|nr:MAG: hypothetical protein E3J62_09390 [candidate division TA06 bacterium]
MGKFAFTADEVDEIVSAPKYIEDPGVLNPTSEYADYPVHMKDGRKYDLIFRFFGNGTCLLLQNKPIRGINWHARHPNPDGSCVFGWHEHIFDDANDSEKVFEVPVLRSVGKRADAKIIIEISRKLWNIDVWGPMGGQLRLQMET